MEWSSVVAFEKISRSLSSDRITTLCGNLNVIFCFSRLLLHLVHLRVFISTELFQLGEPFFRFEVKRVCVSSVSLYARLTSFLYLSEHCNVLLISSSFASVLVRN